MTLSYPLCATSWAMLGLSAAIFDIAARLMSFSAFLFSIAVSCSIWRWRDSQASSRLNHPLSVSVCCISLGHPPRLLLTLKTESICRHSTEIHAANISWIKIIETAQGDGKCCVPILDREGDVFRIPLLLNMCHNTVIEVFSVLRWSLMIAISV